MIRQQSRATKASFLHVSYTPAFSCTYTGHSRLRSSLLRALQELTSNKPKAHCHVVEKLTGQKQNISGFQRGDMKNKTYVAKQSETGRHQGGKRGLRESCTPTYFPWVKTRCDSEIELDSSSSLPLPGTAPSLPATLLPSGHSGYNWIFSASLPLHHHHEQAHDRQEQCGPNFLVLF